MTLKKSLLIVFLILVVDQVSKIYIKLNFPLTLYGELPLFDLGWFKLLFIENKGMAWGATINDFMWIEEIIDIVEKEASSELYALLKRPDEKHVTELAYDNPKFVEDMVRDIAVHFDKDERVSEYIVESENFESIHNHSAYAQIHNIKENS